MISEHNNSYGNEYALRLSPFALYARESQLMCLGIKWAWDSWRLSCMRRP